jgi:mannosyltransferase OCH1-like enzyme
VHMYWTDDMNRKLVEQFYPQHLNMYESYGHWVCKADLVRCMYLHKYGGLYLDLDYWIDRPFFDKIDVSRPSIVESPYGCYDGCHEWLQNSLMASPPDHPLWLEILMFSRSCRGAGNAIQVTGPGMISRAIQSIGWDSNVNILPADEFNPAASGVETTRDGATQASFDDGIVSYARHFLSGSWWRDVKKV